MIPAYKIYRMKVTGWVDIGVVRLWIRNDVFSRFEVEKLKVKFWYDCRVAFVIVGDRPFWISTGI
jgi:hypothetical protein